MCKKKTYAFTMFYDRLEKSILILKWQWSEKKHCVKTENI